MSMKFVNRICPNCKNPNYMVLLDDFAESFKYKCLNCHMFFNDIDFWKEPLQPVWKSECMNTKADMVEVVRCKDCINCVKEPNGDLYCDILAIGYEPLGSKKVNSDWFCADGIAKDTDSSNK